MGTSTLNAVTSGSRRLFSASQLGFVDIRLLAEIWGPDATDAPLLTTLSRRTLERCCPSPPTG
jgi:hypothetical protein